MASFSNNPSDLILGFWMVCSLKVFNVWLHDQQTLCSLCFLFIHISLVGEISELPQGTHKMEQKMMLPLFIDSNTTRSNQPRKKPYLFKTFYRTIFVYIGMKKPCAEYKFRIIQPIL